MFSKSTIQKYQHSKVDVGITSLQCKLNWLSLPYKESISSTVDVCVANLQCPWNLQSLPLKDTQSKVDVGATNLQCPWNLQGLTYKDTKIQGWTLALQTYSVFETCKVYYAKIQTFKGGRWRYKLTPSLKSAKSAIQRYNTFKGGRWRYKLAV